MPAQRFRDHVVWITGGGSGLGRALAVEFARQGADVAVSGRRADRLAEVVAAVEAEGRRGLAVACDVTDDDEVAAAVAAVIEGFGKLDVAVANAGFAVAGKIEVLPIDAWRRQFETNVFGLVSTIRHALPALRATGGRMALVASVAGMLATPKTGAYSASKYAVRAIGQTLAMELHGSGVSCTTIHPGFVASEIAQVDNDGRFDASRRDPRPNKLMWSAEAAARVMTRAIAKRRREYTFTGHGKLGGFLGRHAPGLVHLLMRRG
ncbi:MAG: SDR family NAD(P)-dependent oxidoreductase [Myxococcales bacterium]|nr:SDR family NAD(P)-dependent oxidoreductase [Myxococcales bacterium]